MNELRTAKSAADESDTLAVEGREILTRDVSESTLGVQLSFADDSKTVPRVE